MREINTISKSIPITNESQSRARSETPGSKHIKRIGQQKNHNANITEASSLNKALQKSTVMNMPMVTSMPVAKDANRSFMRAISLRNCQV
jgi:hypothetical protein